MSEHAIDILLRARDLASKQIAGVNKELGKMGGISSRANKGLKTFGSNLKGAVATPLGVLGITGGLFALDKVLEDSVGKAQEFGSEVSRMTALTGMSAESVSALAAGMEHFGIAADDALRTVGMLEKNVGNLTTANAKGQQQVANWNKTHKVAITQQQRLALLYPKAVKFQQQYGLSILNNNGTVKDANQLLLTSADYFNNKSIPAQTKAAALAKLYGRQWQTNIPYFKAGAKGIAAAEEEAKRLGLTLSKDNIDALNKNREATRKWNTALGGLELQIGLKLIPYMTTLADTATQFVSQHGSDITGFFDDAAKFAGEAASAIHDYVIPAFSALGDVWGKIPPDMKKLLIAGFAVNKLSGGALTGIVGELGKGLIKGVLGMTAGVVNINAGVVNGGGVPGAPGGGTPGGGSPGGGTPGGGGGASGAGGAGEGVIKGGTSGIFIPDMHQFNQDLADRLDKSGNANVKDLARAYRDLANKDTPWDKILIGLGLQQPRNPQPNPNHEKFGPPAPVSVHDSERERGTFVDPIVKAQNDARASFEGGLRGVSTNVDGVKETTRSGLSEATSATRTGLSNATSATLSGTSGTTGAVNVGASRTVAAINGAFSRIPAPVVILNVTANSITTKVTQQSRNGTVGGSRSGAGGMAHRIQS